MSTRRRGGPLDRRASFALRSPDARGFSLVEAVVAIFILTIVALSLGQVVGMGVLSNRVAEDLTQATALASTKLEALRASDYDGLVAGGSLDEDLDGYADSPDVDGDGTADFTRRWSIADQTGGKILQVRVLATLSAIGPAKSATVATVMADPDDDLVIP